MSRISYNFSSALAYVARGQPFFHGILHFLIGTLVLAVLIQASPAWIATGVHGINTNAYTYDARGRMASAKVGSITTSYGINGLEQRVSKKGSGVATGTANYVYDEAGQLIGEYDATGKPINETVYLGSLPVGILTASATYTISPDHLGAPRAAHDSKAKDVWSWERLPYGNTLPIASGLTYNLRFPGQYYDAETKLHYNHHRDYDPALTGRYIQSDPIGLSGGINTYAYALNSPTNLTDPKGLFVPAIYACAANPACVEVAAAGAIFAGNIAYQLYANGNVDFGQAAIAASFAFGNALPTNSTRAGTAAEACKNLPKEISLSYRKYPESAKHIQDAIKSGQPSVLTIDRAGAAARRRESLRDISRQPGLDRDEYPPAMFREGGAGSSVRPINPSDNRGAGACIGAQCRSMPDGTPVRINITE